MDFYILITELRLLVYGSVFYYGMAIYRNLSSYYPEITGKLL